MVDIISPSFKAGNNLAGASVILGEADKNRAISYYAETPAYNADMIPRGRKAHIGGGVWLSRCADCDDYILSFGSFAYLYIFAKHQANHEGAVVPGYNVPLINI